MMSPPPRATFLDLPTELLLRIIDFQELDPFTTAQISRRLNSIALAEVFPSLRKNPTHLDSIEIVLHGRHGRDPSNSLQKRFPERKGDFLGLLSIGFDITSIDALTCRILPWASGHGESLWALHLAYQRLALLMRRLESIPRISFHFDPRNLFKSGNPHPEDYRSWVSGLNELLNLCVAKGCQELQVYDATYPLRTDSSRFSVSLKRKLTTYSVNTSQFLPTSVETATLSPEARIASKNLTQFKISAPVLVCTPHLSWTSQLLSASSVTTLTFEGVGMDEDYWIYALPILASPLQTKLKSLEIRNCKSIPPSHFIEFLNKLARLTHLTVLYPIPSFHLERKSLDLPKLVYVRAPVDVLTLLCVQNPLRGSLIQREPRRPGLQTLQIIPRCPEWGQPPCDCTSKVEEVLTAHSHLPNIVWDLEFSTPPSIEPLRDSNGSHYADINNPIPPPSYAYITDIILPAHHISPSFGGSVVFDRVMTFLRRLSGLKSIIIVGKNKGQENEWTEMVEGTFIRRMRSECSWVDRIILRRSSGEEVVHDLRKGE